jgi:hypothetical protein
MEEDVKLIWEKDCVVQTGDWFSSETGYEWLRGWVSSVVTGWG